MNLGTKLRAVATRCFMHQFCVSTNTWDRLEVAQGIKSLQMF